MRSNFDDVGDFHEKFELDNVTHDNVGELPIDPDLLNFRIKFMEEELDEFIIASSSLDHEKMFDALLDLAYVVFGTAQLLGYPWQEGWDEVQSANMKKIRCLRSEDSKRGSKYDVIKPEGWNPPDIVGVLKSNGFKVENDGVNK